MIHVKIGMYRYIGVLVVRFGSALLDIVLKMMLEEAGVPW
jgi:hypothetical protein